MTSTKRRSMAAIAGVVALGVSTILGSSGVSAADTTQHLYNGPADCVAFDSNGNVVAPGPGDCAQFGTAGPGRSNASARNVILIIGDGMGQSEIMVARNYLRGAGGRFEGIDALTSQGMYTHHSIDRDGKVNYVTDSAASGTAWATGTKSYNGAIGVDIAGKPQQNLIEKAKLAGLRTGNVSTAELQDATPAVLGAHALNRKCYGPEQSKNSSSCKGAEFEGQFRENGGLGSISEQLLDTRADVTLGGGAASFNQTVQAGGSSHNPYLPASNMNWTAGETVLQNAKDNGYQVVTTAAELDAVTAANQDRPVLGLFADGNMTTTFAPSQATVGGSKQDPLQCTKQDTGTEPELGAMTQKAIELLDDPTAEKGFFLQVESASIDKRDHSSDACGQIGETGRLDEATKAALDFAKQDGNTLVVVSADHSHTSQIVGDGGDYTAPTTRLLTADKSPMTVAYGTSKGGSQQHTGAQLPIAAWGPGEQNVLGQLDQTDMHFIIANALGLNPDKSSGNTDGNLAKPAAAQATDSCLLIKEDGSVVPGPGDCAQYGTTGQQRSNAKAKNVVLFIGDGMGDSELTSARNYLYGANGRLPGIDNLSYTGSYTHYSLNKDGTVNYVTDSAASGTGWATGTKSYNGAIGVDLAGTPKENLIEAAKAAGLKTGNVSTAELQDATPAVLGAHALNRKCYGPEQSKNSSSCKGAEFEGQFRENGGLGSISEQLVDTRADVTLGGGAAAFNQAVQVSGTWDDATRWTKGNTVLENAKANGYQVVTNADELDAVTAADQEHPVLGLFASGNMPRNFLESVPTVDGATGEAISCQVNPARTADVPTVAAMTTKAMELLRNDKGFFLQVEGASIDKADHDGDACGQIGELDDLDQAVEAAQNWVKQTGEPTLIVVTADHAHASQITANGENTWGTSTKLRTADGSDMTISYNTANSNDLAGKGQGHTGAQLRVAASGPSAENVIGLTDQTDLHYTILNALGLFTESQPVENKFVAAEPTDQPTDEPTTEPTDQPTSEPSSTPTSEPTTRPTQGSGTGANWLAVDNWKNTLATRTFRFGKGQPLVGDWDGDGVDEAGMRAGNTFTLEGAKGSFAYGRASDRVLVGDFNGDGKDTIAVQRGNVIHIKNTLAGGNADKKVAYGKAGDVAFAGDFDGNGEDTFAVRRGNTFHVKNALAGGRADVMLPYGKVNDRAVIADFNGDRIDTPAVVR
ncbi:alkaline phosphatase [Neoactinobaculum massilliense]|uniref:alkaline phosphatase n=1 Tax=Neoactinobaculum massilliense TaxID=2364794 RepID=UPI000F5374AC|nr:alkaline phosphatase [Neoactinobaculum massilliense]